MTTLSISVAAATALLAFCEKHNLEEFFIAGDQGVYFGANTGSEEENSFEGSIHYIKDCDPAKDEDWHHVKRMISRDDFGEELPVSWLKTGLARKGKRTFSLKMTPSSIKLV